MDTHSTHHRMDTPSTHRTANLLVSFF